MRLELTKRQGNIVSEYLEEHPEEVYLHTHESDAGYYYENSIRDVWATTKPKGIWTTIERTEKSTWINIREENN